MAGQWPPSPSRCAEAGEQNRHPGRDDAGLHLEIRRTEHLAPVMGRIHEELALVLAVGHERSSIRVPTARVGKSARKGALPHDPGGPLPPARGTAQIT